MLSKNSLNQEYCCENIFVMLKNQYSALQYIPQWRVYSLEYHYDNQHQQNAYIVGESLNFCPFCGVRFPEQLVDVLFNVLQNEYNIQDTWNNILAGTIPDECKTDEWWKKRGL